jgi:hypothetical protein
MPLQSLPKSTRKSRENRNGNAADKSCRKRNKTGWPELNSDSLSPIPDLKYGDVVRVRDGFRHPDLDVGMSGWHGRVSEIYQDEGTALIAFDSLTLLDLPESFIEQFEEEGYSWNDFCFPCATWRPWIQIHPKMTSYISTATGLLMLEKVSSDIVQHLRNWRRDGLYNQFREI